MCKKNPLPGGIITIDGVDIRVRKLLVKYYNALKENYGQYVSYSDIDLYIRGKKVSSLNGSDYDRIRASICALRKVLRAANVSCYIITIHSKGFVLTDKKTHETYLKTIAECNTRKTPSEPEQLCA